MAFKSKMKVHMDTTGHAHTWMLLMRGCCREGGDGHPVTYTAAELNSTFLKQMAQPIGWLGAANCSSPEHFQLVCRNAWIRNTAGSTGWAGA